MDDSAKMERQINFRVSGDLWNAARRHSLKTGIPVAKMLRMSLLLWTLGLWDPFSHPGLIETGNGSTERKPDD